MKMIVVFIVLFAALLCARAVKPGPKVTARTASWYGEECRGRLMANGQPFDPAGFTCASWDYPLGTRLLVVANGHMVLVTVTDRGPAKRLLATRQLDLSEAAFRLLAPLPKGLVNATVIRV